MATTANPCPTLNINPSLVAQDPFPPLGQPRSFASVTTGGVARPTPRFPSIRLPPRQHGHHENMPSIAFTAAEVQAGAKRLEFSIVAKFTFGKPSLHEIQKAFQAEWKLIGRATISEVWDGRHILIILDSEEDVKVAMACPLRKIGHAMFRMFRWSMDYDYKHESKVTTAWLRLPGLPLPLFDRAFIEAIVAPFSKLVDVDERTKAYLSLRTARACVEVDVTKIIPDKVWISMGNNKEGVWQPIVVESKLSFCSKSV